MFSVTEAVLGTVSTTAPLKLLKSCALANPGWPARLWLRLPPVTSIASGVAVASSPIVTVVPEMLEVQAACAVAGATSARRTATLTGDTDPRMGLS